jgi:hypothetical protein
MPRVLGQDVVSVEECLGAIRRHGNALRGTYRVTYVCDRRTQDPYAGATLERPPALEENPADVIYPWEQVLVAAGNCAGSDYPLLATHLGVPIDRVEFVLECVFDPRGEFDGLDGFKAPSDAKGCYLSLTLRTTLTSTAPRDMLERTHRRVIDRNMVLGALRGIPRTDELAIVAAAEVATD